MVLMKSPITGKAMVRKEEPGIEVTYRNEKFTITHHFWLCTDSGERFTDTEMDDAFLEEVGRLFKERTGKAVTIGS